MQNETTFPVSNQDKKPQWVAYCALALALMTFIFGDNIAERSYNALLPVFGNNVTIIEGIIALLNIGLAAFVLIDLRFLHPTTNPIHSTTQAASGSFDQLLNGWKLLWGTWIVFYCCLGAQWFHLFPDTAKSYIPAISDALNIINAFFFYYLFFVLDQPSVPTEEQPNRARSFRRNILVTGLIGGGVYLASTFFSYSEINSGLPKDTANLLSNLVPAYIAVGMAFFFGRLDSHYLRLHRIILAPLYLYAVIQLYWGPEVPDNSRFNSGRVAILVMALVLKFVIFYTFSRLLRDERFQSYFVVALKGLKENGK